MVEIQFYALRKVEYDIRTVNKSLYSYLLTYTHTHAYTRV